MGKSKESAFLVEVALYMHVRTVNQQKTMLVGQLYRNKVFIRKYINGRRKVVPKMTTCSLWDACHDDIHNVRRVE